MTSQWTHYTLILLLYNIALVVVLLALRCIHIRTYKRRRSASDDTLFLKQFRQAITADSDDDSFTINIQTSSKQTRDEFIKGNYSESRSSPYGGSRVGTPKYSVLSPSRGGTLPMASKMTPRSQTNIRTASPHLYRPADSKKSGVFTPKRHFGDIVHKVQVAQAFANNHNHHRQ